MLRAGRNFVRLIEMAFILARYDALTGLGDIIGAGVLLRATRLFRRRDAALAALRPGERLATALQAMGPSFIKLGQALSIRADLIGDAMAADLAALQDRLPPFPAASARQMIETELGQPVAQLYRDFDDLPVAAASIAQVHFAVTAEGEEVAVKVLRPGIHAAFARDLVLFFWLARLIERTQPALRRLRPVAVVASQPNA